MPEIKPESIPHDPIKLAIAESVQHTLTKLGIEMELTSIYAKIGFPPNMKMGHFAYPCFELAKVLRNAPNRIAQQLQETMGPSPWFSKVMAAGPYLNFFIAAEKAGTEVAEAILSGAYFEKELASGLPKTMIEYSQPNTHKELHVGHMRNLSLGDALIHLHKYCGFDIISATFPGDVGTHVAKCLWFLKYHNDEPMPETEKGAWLGRMYAKGSIKLKEEEGTELENQNKKQLSEILDHLEAGSGEFYELWKTTREWSIAQMKKVYDWAGVTFDKWYWESEVDVPSVKYARELFDKGIAVESKGVIGVDLEEDNLGFCVLIKSDGHGLYATKDLELARRKFEDYQIEKSVYIVDKRQAHHFAQVFKVLEKAGFEQAMNCYHLKYDYVELIDGPISSRSGNIVPVLELIRNMETTIKSDYLDKYKGEWPDGEIEEVARIVAIGAIKYGMVKIDPDKKIVFEMEKWLALQGESGPYVQYAFARINTMCKKQGYDPNAPRNWGLLKEELEEALLVKCTNFNQVALDACLNYKTNTLASYLYDLGKLFNSFYNNHSIKDAATPELKAARLGLSAITAEILKKGLALLGIPVPERM